MTSVHDSPDVGLPCVCRRGGCPNPARPGRPAPGLDGWAGYCDPHLAVLRATGTLNPAGTDLPPRPVHHHGEKASR